MQAEDMCRCCMQQSEEMQSLFGASIDVMLMEITSITVQSDDGLPVKICRRCLLLVSRMFTFKRQCEETDRQLRQTMLPKTRQMLDASAVSTTTGDTEVCTESIGGDDTIPVPAHEGKRSSRGSPPDTEVGSVVEEETFETGSHNLLFSSHSGNFQDTDKINYPPENGDRIEYEKLESLQLLQHDEAIELEKKAGVESCTSIHSIESNIEAESHLCGVCSKRFDRFAQLRRHLKTHMAEKPHRCPVCGKTFAESSNLKKHMASHTGELRNVSGLPHLCAVCGKRFKFASSLSRHGRTHSRRRKRFSCPYCQELFLERSALIVHTYGHTNRKPFACQQCPKAFARRVNLVRHERSHTGEKPFPCPQCGKQFSQQSYLTIHRRIHANQKPYRCEACGKRFVASSGLAVHRRTHRVGDVCECARCGQHFERKTLLKRHLCTASKPDTEEMPRA